MKPSIKNEKLTVKNDVKNDLLRNFQKIVKKFSGGSYPEIS